MLLAGQKGQLTQETELLESLIEKVEDHVAHSSKTDLIKRSEELLMMFKQVKPALNIFLASCLPTILPPATIFFVILLRSFYSFALKYCIVFISSHLSTLTSAVIGAPQMTLQQYLSTLPCSLLKGISKPHSHPFLDVIFPSLLLSSSPSCSFHCPLQNCLRHAQGSEFPFFLPRLGDHHTLQLHSGFCCKPALSSHGLCRKYAEVSYRISTQGLGYFC